MLTGRPPFDGATVLVRLMAHQERVPSSLLAARPDVTKAIDAVYQKTMAKKPADRPASMSAVVQRLETCRSSKSAANEARSGLKSFATSVIMKRGSPMVTVGESVFDRDEPAGDSLDVNPVLDNGDSGRPAAPVARTVVEAPALMPRRASTDHHRHEASPHSLAVSLGAIAVLAIGCIGYLLFPRGASKPPADGGTASTPQDSWDVKKNSTNSPPQRPPQEPRPPAILDVATLYSILGTDGHTGSVETIAVTADFRRALIGSWTEHSYLIDVDAGKKVDPSLGFHDGWQGARPTVAMTPDGRRALIGTGNVRKDNLKRAKVEKTDGILWFWDLATGEELFPKRQPYEGTVASVAISPDGLWGLSASHRREVTLWDLATGEPRSLGTQQGDVSSHNMDFFPMAFFPDGRHAATAVHDELVHIWNLDTGREQAVLRGHGTTISGLVISADGLRIVTGSFDGTVILWDVAHMTCDGSSVVDWGGDPKRLIRFVQWRVPDRKSLFLASSSSILFREMTLTPLAAARP